MNTGRWLPALAAVVLSSGCAATSERQYTMVARTGDPIIDGHSFINLGPPRDRVLWQYRTALAALRRGRDDEARGLLDDALLTAGGVLAHDPNARKARSYFHREARKTFLGEPYERVMAYYYRGILYWKDGELDNARSWISASM